MKKLFITLLALTLLFSASCTKEVPEDIPEEKQETVELTPIEQVREHINNEEIEKAYELLLTLEGEEAEELLSHFTFQKTYFKNINGDGKEFEEICEYDKHGNLLKKSNSDNNFSEFEYDEKGRRTKATYTTEKRVESQALIYDEEDRIVQITVLENGELLSTEKITYDKKGNKINTLYKNENGYTREWSAEYNENGDFLSTLHNSNGYIDKNVYEYDGEGRVLKHTYTSGNGVISIDEFVYGEDGKVQTLTSENGRLLQKITYDKDGKEISAEYSPEYRVGLIREDREYDENGNLKRITRVELDENGKEIVLRTNFTLDEKGRVIKREETGASGDVFLEITSYHENGNIASQESRQNGERTLLITYNEEGKRARQTTPTYDYIFAYDEFGNLLSLTDALSHYREEHSYKLYYNPTNFKNEEIY